MRTRRNVTGIAVLLAFQGWMYLVAGMMSPSEVVAENHKVPWHVAQRVARAKMWKISGIISEATARNPGVIAEIVEQSIKVRTEASDTIIGAALQTVPQEASKIMAGALLAMSEPRALEPRGTQLGTQPSKQTVSSKSVNDGELNYQLFGVDLFPEPNFPFNFITDPNAGDALEERIITATCQFLGTFGITSVDECVSPAL